MNKVITPVKFNSRKLIASWTPASREFRWSLLLPWNWREARRWLNWRLLERQVANTMANEIRDEIDREILENIEQLAARNGR